MKEPELSFDEIRPYRDEEVNKVLARIANKPSFLKLAPYMFPHLKAKEIQEGFTYVQSTRAFQALYIHQGMRSLVGNSTDGLSYEGIKQLDKKTPYLFLSNHRDIILDSAFLNILLFEHGYDTTEIAIGDNLMVSPLVTDLMKLNKSFIVHRDIPRSDMLAYAQRLSTYVRHVLVEQGQSIWMAQRNGRTKDGLDETAPGLLKMLSMSGEKDLYHNIGELNLTPLAISYEFEPCAGLKAEELVHRKLGIPYEKDDKIAIIQGINASKGRVHLAVGQILTDELRQIDTSLRKNDWLRELARLVDQKIHSLYKKWPNTYLAADLLCDKPVYEHEYTAKEKERFMSYLDQELSGLHGDPELLRQQILSIYAGPLLQQEAMSVK